MGKRADPLNEILADATEISASGLEFSHSPLRRGFYFGFWRRAIFWQRATGEVKAAPTPPLLPAAKSQKRSPCGGERIFSYEHSIPPTGMKNVEMRMRRRNYVIDFSNFQ